MSDSFIIGMAGPKGSGKDAVFVAAQKLGLFPGAKRFAFADKMREAALALDPIITVDESGFIRLSHLIDKFGWDYVKNHYPEARRTLQRLGTEAGRDILGPDVWVDSLMRDMGTGCAFINDVRFLNEAMATRQRGGVIIEVRRNGFEYSAEHASEAGLPRDILDASIYNNGDIDETVENLCDVLAVHGMSIHP